jgi:serine/threonine protein kinase
MENRFNVGNDADCLNLYNHLKTMYIDCFDVPFMEKLYNFPMVNDRQELPFVDTKRILRFSPVGMLRMPANVAEIKKCLICLLICLSEFHKRNYVHCDIRWTNIIVFHGDWYLIDFTYAKKLDDAVGLLSVTDIIREKYVMKKNEPWNPRFDYFQIGKLLDDTIFSHHERFINIKDNLLSKEIIDVGKLLISLNNVNEN